LQLFHPTSPNVGRNNAAPSGNEGKAANNVSRPNRSINRQCPHINKSHQFSQITTAEKPAAPLSNMNTPNVGRKSRRRLPAMPTISRRPNTPQLTLIEPTSTKTSSPHKYQPPGPTYTGGRRFQLFHPTRPPSRCYVAGPAIGCG